MDDLESSIDKAGGFGLYQFGLSAISLLPLIFVAANMGATIFEALIPEVRCKEDISDLMMKNCNSSLLEPVTSALTMGVSPHCVRYNLTGSNDRTLYMRSHNTTTTCNQTLQDRVYNVIPCEEWIFDRSSMRSTVVSEFELVCDNIWAGYFAQSALMLGVGLGSIATGLIADRVGRRNAFLLSSFGSGIFGISVSFSRSYLTYCITRFFLGLFVFSAFPALFVLNSETTVRKYRSLVGQILELSFPLGFIFLSLVSFALREWRMIQLTISVPFVVGILIWWFMPESPRWLYHKDRKKEALQIIDKIYKTNRTFKNEEDSGCVEAPPKYKEVRHPQVEVYDSDYDTISILEHPNLRGACFKLFYSWFAISCVYYGLTLNAAELGGDPFANLCLNSIAEIVAVILTVPLVNISGRRIVGFVSETLAGIFCIIVVFIPKGILPIAILGKFSISIAFSTMYIHTNEIYPTPIRTSGIGVCNAMARLGGVLSPIIAMLRTEYPPLPYIIFGMLAMVSGALVLTLPETRCTRLPQTIREGENFISADRGLRSSCKRASAI